MKHPILRILASTTSIMFSVLVSEGHNLDTRATGITFAFAQDFLITMSSRASANQLLVQVTDVAYVLPDATDSRGFRNIPMKGQSPIAIGNGSITSASSFDQNSTKIEKLRDYVISSGGKYEKVIAVPQTRTSTPSPFMGCLAHPHTHQL